MWGKTKGSTGVLPIATTSSLGVVKAGNGIGIDTSGEITPKLGIGLKLDGTYSVIPDVENIDVTQLKNFDSIVIGSPKGFFESTATLATFSSCVKGDFCIYDGTETFSLGGYTFNSGDQLWCNLTVSSTLTNLTSNFKHVAVSIAKATTASFGTVKLGSATPLANSATAAAGTSQACAREDHVHPPDSTKEPTITVGTTSQYYRGDKSWQTLNKAAVGLGNVDNTSDADKPISAAQAAVNAQKLNVVDAPTVPIWGGNSPVRAAELRKCTTAVGDFKVGQLITSKDDRITGAVFNTAEAAYWETTGGLDNVTNESKTTMFTSPIFTGTPTAPTASAGTNTTQIATTAFVINQISKPSYMRVYNSVAQTVSTVGTIVQFSNIESSLGSDISLSSNCFLLKAGNIYELSATAGYASFSGAGWVQYRWRTGQVGGSGTFLGTSGEIDACSLTLNSAAGASVATAIYIPTVDTYIHLEIVGASLLTSIGTTAVATIKVMH